MRQAKRIPWAIIGVACAALLIIVTSGALPNRERQLEDVLARGDADTLLRLVHGGLDPKTEVCTGYTTPDWTYNFPFRLLPDSVWPTRCAAKSPLLVEAVRHAKGPNAHALVSELLQHGADCNSQSHAGDTPLIAAVDTADVNAAQLLLDHGVALNTSDARRAFYEALRSGNAYIVRLFLAHKQSPHERFAYDNDKTPLMVAAQNGAVQSVELLLQQKAVPNAQDADGETALGIALGSRYGYSHDKRRIAQMLLRHGASLFIKDHDGAMPIDRLRFTRDFYKATGQMAKIPRVLRDPPSR